MTLYNLKSADGQYRITKFTNDLDVESSYILSETECECPAGSRPSCRHRQMLPTMLAEALCDSGGFYDFDNGQVLVPATEEEHEVEIELTGQTEPFNLTATEIANRPSPELKEPLIEYMVNQTFNALPHPSIGPIKRRI